MKSYVSLEGVHTHTHTGSNLEENRIDISNTHKLICF